MSNEMMTQYPTGRALQGVGQQQLTQSAPQETHVRVLCQRLGETVKRLEVVDDRLRRFMGRAVARGYPAQDHAQSNKVPAPVQGDIGAMRELLDSVMLLASDLETRCSEIDEIA